MTRKVSHVLSDPALVLRAQAAEQEAVDVLVTAARAAVHNYARARLGGYAGGAEAAEDVAQETCVALLRALPGYRDQGAPFSAFVYGIAARKVADAQRAFARAAVPTENLPDDEVAPAAEEGALARLDADAAHCLLGQLPPRMRQIMLLRARGADAASAGRALGMSANAVRVAHHRASIRLRRMVEDSPEYSELFGRPSAGGRYLAAS